jgi:hypothetical protein
MYASAEGNSGDTRSLHSEPWTKQERETDELNCPHPMMVGKKTILRTATSIVYNEYPPHRMGPVHRGKLYIHTAGSGVQYESGNSSRYDFPSPLLWTVYIRE